MIWLRGEDQEKAMARLFELLLFCNTSPDRVWSIAPMQFVNFITGGIDRLFMEGSRVLVVRGFEHLTQAEMVKFLGAIKLFRALQYGVGIRLIIASAKEVSAELHRIHEFMPMLIEVGVSESDPVEIDSRVHSLVEVAARVAETPIRRLTESAAHFLEEKVGSNESEEILVLLVEGIRRSRGSVLRLRDILPNFAHYFGPEDESESYCN
ncbi:MAG: hypothetical protein KGP28_13075 [Bdellovibrionales bacterium]|nr:hypothetical protein [Bdellovibrionales bacterium]